MAMRWVAAPYLFFALLLLLALFSPQGAASQAAVTDTHVRLWLMRKMNQVRLKGTPLAFYSGMNASLWARNCTVAEGVRVEVVEKEEVQEGNIAILEEEIRKDKNVLALVGKQSGEFLQLVLPLLKKYDLVSFAPFTGSSLVRGWNPNLYFVRADPAVELLALLRHAWTHLRVHRLGFMYLQGVSFGDREYAQAQRVMLGMGYNLSGVFTVKSSMSRGAKKEVFDAAWKAFAKTQPQAVIVFGPPIQDTVKFIKRMLTDYRTAGAYLLAPLMLQDFFLRAWQGAVAGGVELVPGQVITTGTSPLAKDIQYAAIQRFQRVMRDYLAHSGQKDYVDKDHFLKDDGDGAMMVAGWIAGEVLSQALGNREWVKNRTSFLTSLYNQRRYVVDDIVIGDYGGECKSEAASQGATCLCNQGGRTVHIDRVMGAHRLKPFKGVMRFPLSNCNVSYVKIPPVFIGLYLLMDDNIFAFTACLQFEVVFAAASSLHERWWEQGAVFAYSLQSNTYDSAGDLRSELQSRRAHAVLGVVTDAMLDVEGMTFIDPLFLEPRLNRFRRNVIRLSPTLEQQFFVIARYLGKTSGGSAHAVIRSGEAAAMAEVLRLSLETFGGSLLSTKLLAGGDKMADHLPAEGDVFVVGISADDVGAIARHVASNDGVRVFVVFSEFALLHAEFVAAFRDCAGADRVVFATSLPHWNDENSTSETTKKFVIAVPEKKRTPLAMMGFAAMGLMHQVFLRMDRISAELLADFIYTNVEGAVDDILYGPFIDGNACPVTESGAGCGKNYGATQISVWPLARALDPAVPVLSHAVTLSMEYRRPVARGLTAQQLIGVIVGSVAAALLLIALILLLLYFCRDSRDNENAPKERTDPVTLVFTDIESSTALWAACPEVMPDAVETHHRLIRSLIAKYRCYEVKTIGDSFMIACKSVFAAVQLVRELQQVFLQHDWGTSVIDDAYHKFEEGRAGEDEEYVPPTARLDDAVYRQSWNGLRVRVGVHTGLCDIRRDEVTKGYDYYGGTSNMAARTESVGNGGQVLLTRAAYFALSTAEREQVEVTALGGVALRGVPEPVEMYQLDAVPGRTFAALRLDREMPDLDDGSDLASGDGSVSTERSVPSGYIASVLAVVFGTFSAPQRLEALLPLCQRWSVPVPSGDGEGREKDVCRVAMERLAAKVCSVFKKRASEVSVGEGLGTMHLSKNTLLWNDGVLRPRNFSLEGGGFFWESHWRSGMRQASLSTAEEPWWAEGDPVATIRVRRLA
ncbi:putative receptor-type adenylate cyclase [Trypanosoma cruzi]|uniref:adenylate cyclase n=1 Tax=Trypanosoma cruzi TaxID=5693 RepID=A0A2V2VSE7_TRYCR|nr:putative receptor-type adenylate cyclase [Trypanosoma cruzi]